MRYLIILFLLFSCKEEVKTIPEKVVKSSNQVTKKPISKSKITKNFVLGKHDYKSNKQFIKLKDKHSYKENYLDKEVYHAFVKMYDAAKNDDVFLKIMSATRNFDEQKEIWNAKWLRYNDLSPKERVKKILEYSSMPTTSRHHWGTEIDLNMSNNGYFGSGEGKKSFEWLHKNAANFGFHQVYTSQKNGRTGYHLEKWHWSYLPLSKKYLDFYNKNISYKDIIGFKGSKFARERKMIKNYVNGISIKIK